MTDIPPRRGTLALAVLCASWLACQSALAGPWTKQPGHSYAKLSGSLFVAEGFRDQTGRFVADTSYVGINTSLYGEVGLVPSLQLQLLLPHVVGINELDEDSLRFVASTCRRDGRRARSTRRMTLGDAQLGLQWAPELFGLPHAVRFTSKLPLYDPTQPGDDASLSSMGDIRVNNGRCGDLFAQPGDGQLDFTLWLSLGDSLHPLPFFVFAEVGHRHRTEVYPIGNSGLEFVDTFLFFAQAGYELAPGAFLLFDLSLALPYVVDLTTRGALSFGPRAIVPLAAGFALEAGVEFTPWAVNAGQGRASRLFWTGASVGLSHKL